MINVEEIIKSIEKGTAKLELIIDRAREHNAQNVTSESGYMKVYEKETEEAHRALYKKGEEYFYSERIYCADLEQTGSCNVQYEKLYKVIL